MPPTCTARSRRWSGPAPSGAESIADQATRQSRSAGARRWAQPGASGREAEERGHARRVEHRRHLVVGGAALEAVPRVQDSRKQRQVAGRVDEDAGQAEDPVHRAVDVRLLLEGLVPRGVRPGVGGSGAAGDRLDDLHRDVPLPADAQHLFEVPPVSCWAMKKLYGKSTASKSKRARLRRCIAAMVQP